MSHDSVQTTFPDADDWHHRATASVNGRQIVRGAENHDIVRDVAARPSAYAADEDAVRIEIFVIPIDWNSQHEDVVDPVLTYFVPTWANAVLVLNLVEAQRRQWIDPLPDGWCVNLEARPGPGSTQAKMTTPVDIVLAVAAWVSSGRLQQYIP